MRKSRYLCWFRDNRATRILEVCNTSILPALLSRNYISILTPTTQTANMEFISKNEASELIEQCRHDCHQLFARYMDQIKLTYHDATVQPQQQQAEQIHKLEKETKHLSKQLQEEEKVIEELREDMRDKEETTSKLEQQLRSELREAKECTNKLRKDMRDKEEATNNRERQLQSQLRDEKERGNGLQKLLSREKEFKEQFKSQVQEKKKRVEELEEKLRDCQRIIEEQADELKGQRRPPQQTRQVPRNSGKLLQDYQDRVYRYEGGFRLLVVPKPCGSELSKKTVGTTTSAEFHSFNHTITTQDASGRSCSFDYDHVFQPVDYSTDHIWEVCTSFVDSIFTQPPPRLMMMAHGLEGSGKTHIMAHKEQGLVSRTLKHILKLCQWQKESGHKVVIEATVTVVYNDERYDDQGNKLAYTPGPKYPHTRTMGDHGKKSSSNSGSRVLRKPLDSDEDVSAFIENVSQQDCARKQETPARRSHVVVAIFVIFDRGDRKLEREASMHLVDLASRDRTSDREDTMSASYKVLLDQSRLNAILPHVHARSRQCAYNRTQSLLGRPTEEGLARTTFRESIFEHNQVIHRCRLEHICFHAQLTCSLQLSTELQLPLEQQDPRLLVFLTIDLGAPVHENVDTLKVGYLWSGRTAPGSNERSADAPPTAQSEGDQEAKDDAEPQPSIPLFTFEGVGQSDTL
jgi:hypothetical protein